MAVADSVDPDGWMVTFNELIHRVAGRFGRVEPRRTATGYVRGLLADLERKNCWNLAEHAGPAGPQAMQRLLRTARWDADALRDDVGDYVTEQLGPQGALVVPAGRALLDRRLYLPQHTWLADPDRCAAAGVPEQAAFATKPAPAGQMITAAVEAGVRADWVTGDEVYGQDPACAPCCTSAGSLRPGHRRQPQVNLEGAEKSAAEIAADVTDRHWHHYSAGQGAKGPRYYLWAWARIDADQHDGSRWLLIRRNPVTGELAYYRCSAPEPTPLPTLVRVAGIRWTIEESFLAALSTSQPDPDDERIPLTMPEIRRLLVLLIPAQLRSAEETMIAECHWSTSGGSEEAERVGLFGVAATGRLSWACDRLREQDIPGSMRW
ncbi:MULTISPECIES: transposase [unclassified Nonomuraea]|uniref:transposase n=1 Tax=unclassified Nonomuraea TaxID=2593643 RepID=UPI0033D83FCD